jgi:ABC-type ATPase involved in cell division
VPRRQRILHARTCPRDWRASPGLPTGNLDAERSADILELLSQVNARGTTVVVATHDRQLLARFGKRVLVLEGGRVAAEGFVENAGERLPLR